MSSLCSLVLACLAAPGLIAAESLTAADVLHKVRDTYTRPDTLQMESTTFWGVRSDKGITQHEESRSRIALQGNNKLFVEKAGGLAHYVRVADGRNTWLYLPERNRYDVSSGVSDTRDADDQFLHRFREFATAAPAAAAQILREETVMIEGAPVDCYVVQIDMTGAPPSPHRLPALYTWWVEQKRFVVLREEHARTVRINKKQEVEQFSLTDISQVKVNEPIPPEVFRFTPPAGAKKVNALGTP